MCVFQEFKKKTKKHKNKEKGARVEKTRKKNDLHAKGQGKEVVSQKNIPKTNGWPRSHQHNNQMYGGN